MLNLSYNKYNISLINEPMYSTKSVDNVRMYECEYVLNDGNDFYFNSKHGIRILEDEQIRKSCILLASGGGTGIHPHSAVIVKDNIYVAVGNIVCSLDLPSLSLQWHKQADLATCFGIYYLSDQDSLIVRGECDISKITRTGDLVWNASGKDIFSEGFQIMGDYIKAIDFNYEEYRIRLKDGHISLTSDIG